MKYVIIIALLTTMMSCRHNNSPFVEHINWVNYKEIEVQENLYIQHPLASNIPDTPDHMVLIPGGKNSGINLIADRERYGVFYHRYYRLVGEPFFMSVHPVTKEKWIEVRKWGLENMYTDLPVVSWEDESHPVHSVSWYDAVKWCNALSEMEGKIPAYYIADTLSYDDVYRTGRFNAASRWVKMNAGYRLPTSEEWEYAARGGRAGLRFPWGDTIDHTRANYLSTHSYSYDKTDKAGFHPSFPDSGPNNIGTSPVGFFEPNGYGLYDMVGNVQEWVFDWKIEGFLRIVRGGGWIDGEDSCRIGTIRGYHPGSQEMFIGFRYILPVNIR